MRDESRTSHVECVGSEKPRLYDTSELATDLHTERSVYSQSRLTVLVNTNSTELVSIVRSRNMFAFNIESYSRTGRGRLEYKFGYYSFVHVSRSGSLTLRDALLLFIRIPTRAASFRTTGSTLKKKSPGRTRSACTPANVEADKNRKHRLLPPPRLEFDDTSVKHKSLY
ncbi:hypothetical protein ANN_20142 [Periplaneta americana]|uniref:Uncharacterized protein n=1 Tax=Periplaneta americana TaxID=6978 RepID=A0ABQ8SC89_PERAM|nr:hypothetical protein ANN_20142 [Periplaneta americana]